MARKRVIYQSEALFVGLTGSSSLTQLRRVQSANYGFDVTRTDINQFGQVGAIDRILTEEPVVNLDFSYYVTSGENELALGFALGASQGAFANIMTGNRDMNNFYILVGPEGLDANINTFNATGAGSKVIGIGNGGLTSYGVEAAVGGFPTVTVNAEALNMRFYPASTGYLPEINPENGAQYTTTTFAIPKPSTGDGFTALRPGDISIDVSGLGVNASDLKIQSFSLTSDIGRDSIRKLGSKFAFSREITYPITVNATVEAVVGDIADSSQSYGNSLTELICDDKPYTLTFNLGQPSTTCDSTYTPLALKYTLKGARLDSQSFSSSIGDNKTVTMNFSAPIGGPNDTNNGLFIQSNVT